VRVEQLEVVVVGQLLAGLDVALREQRHPVHPVHGPFLESI
jgi:hypothetical protein